MKKKKTLCEEVSHSWKETASLNWRICQRSECQQAQHFIHGQWCDVKKPVKRSQQTYSYQKVLPLFSSRERM